MRHSIRSSRPPAQTTTSFPSSSSSRGSRFRQYEARRRYWLSALAVLFIVIMVVGIVLVAHKYYHDLGGQGWLKMRRDTVGLEAKDVPDVYLPLRKVEVRDGDESLLVYGIGYIRRSPEDVPFYLCGDQQQSCEAYGQPVS